MKRRNTYTGFTMIELTVAIGLTAIIVLTAGIVLQSSQRAITRQTAMAGLQSDMRVALPALYELAREGSSADVTAPALNTTGTVFTVGTNSIYRANSSLTADSSGKSLAFARGTGGNSKMALSSGWLANFSAIRTTNAISFTLVLNNTNDTMSVSNAKVYFRN